jgi:hypothetical protein
MDTYCDRCGTTVKLHELWCTSCGGRAHPGPCPEEDTVGLGFVCEPCWAILSHVERVLTCAAGCDCARRYADVIARARADIEE